MVNASDIAAHKFDSPLKIVRTRNDHTLAYSKYAPEIFRHLTFHRVSFVSDFPRLLPHRFKKKRLAHRHLDTLAVEGHIDVLQYDCSVNKPNLIVINDRGFEEAGKQGVCTNAAPAKYVPPKGDHILHEALVTEVASRRVHFLRTTPGYALTYQERHGFHRINGFDDFLPDYGDAFKGPHGAIVDLCEILTGTESSTKVRQKLMSLEAWWKTKESTDYLQAVLKATGASTDAPAFRYLIVAHNRNVVGSDESWEREILNLTFRLHPDLQRRIWTTTIARIRQHDTLDAPIWFCGATLVKHRESWKETVVRRRCGFLADKQQEEKRLPLFSIGS